MLATLADVFTRYQVTRLEIVSVLALALVCVVWYLSPRDES